MGNHNSSISHINPHKKATPKSGMALLSFPYNQSIEINRDRYG